MLELVLVAGKIFFLVVLYVFVLLVIRSAVRDLRTRPSAVVQAEAAPLAVAPPASARRPGPAPGAQSRGVAGGHGPWELVVVESRVLAPGSAVALPPSRPVRLGRAPDNDIQLRDTFVSSHHATVEVTGDGLLLTDLGSTNGTFVDGAEIDGSVVLEPGVRVAVGDTVFQVATA